MPNKTVFFATSGRAVKIFFVPVLLIMSVALCFAAPDDISEKQKHEDILQFGLETEITDLVTTLMKDKNTDYTADILKVFNKTKSISVREKMIEYFTAIQDKSLADYAVSLLEDPYDEKKTTVDLVFKYVSELKLQEAAAPIRVLLDSGNEEYQEAAVRALGKTGGSDDAVFLAEYLKQDLSLPVKQALVGALGELKAVETWDYLVEIAKNSDENGFMRMHAAEAIGLVGKPEGADILISLFEEKDANLRVAVIRGLANFDTPEAKAVILEAFRDNYYKVRIEAAAAAEKLKMKEAVPYLIYRAKNDPEKVVKMKCYESLAVLGLSDGTDYLLTIVNDAKMNETLRVHAAALLLQYHFDRGISDILKLAADSLKDDKLKNIRYALGKEFVKYESPRFAQICEQYMLHKDVSTKGIGLDIYAKNRFSELSATVKGFADDDKMGSIQKKAKGILSRE